MIRLASLITAFASCLLLIMYDASFHFDRNLIGKKKAVHSAQRNWNLFYGQRWVYQDSAFRYEEDFSRISTILKPESVVLSDLATSYYMSAALPVFIVNVHNHQGRANQPGWKTFLDNRYLCYLERPENFKIVEEFLQRHSELTYIVINRDTDNSNLQNDCLSRRGGVVSRKLPELARKVYQGRYLDLYQVQRGAGN